MAHIGEKLRELLENPELRDALADAFHIGIDCSSKFNEISLADHLRHARGIDVYETPFEGLSGKLREVIQSLVIDRLPQPTPIALDDLVPLAISHLAGIDLSQVNVVESIEHAYQRFVTCAVLEIQECRDFGPETSHSLGCEWGLPEPDSSLAQYPYSASQIWQSESGFSFSCWVEHYGEDCTDEVHGSFNGCCTERALQQVEAQFGGIVDSIANTLLLCHHDGDISISFIVAGEGQSIFEACLSACCQVVGKEKATILDRLRNAVILLSHADSASGDPVTLSLSFSAIEALVCEKDEVPVNKQIKRHVSTLLVQNADKRRAREKVLGQLYEIRSQVMHGNQVRASLSAARCVRRIAAGVVRGVVSWMAHQERMGADTSWKEFMDEINAASRKPDIVVGVPDLSDLIPAKFPS